MGENILPTTKQNLAMIRQCLESGENGSLSILRYNACGIMLKYYRENARCAEDRLEASELYRMLLGLEESTSR